MNSFLNSIVIIIVIHMQSSLKSNDFCETQHFLTMPGLQSLSEVLLVHVLDLSSDALVLELAAASRALRSGVEACRQVASEGPWQHAPGTWEACGLWRYLGLGDLKMIPAVTLCCETKFQHRTELLAFLKAVKALAAETFDGYVAFNQFTFDARKAASIFSREDMEGDDFMTESHQTVEVVFNGCRLNCSLSLAAHSQPEDSDGEIPWVNVYVDIDDGTVLLQNPLICCSSVLLPDLRLFGSFCNIYNDHELDAESPLTQLVRANMPLPMLFGVKGVDDGLQPLIDLSDSEGSWATGEE